MSPRILRLIGFAIVYLLAVGGLALVVLGAGPRPPRASPAASPTGGPASGPSFSRSPSPASAPSPSAAALIADPASMARPPADPGFATRVVIAKLGIDLPVVAQNAGYPYCDVAMSFTGLGQPGRGRATYVYAHARAGMFLPIYDLVQAGRQATMIGMVIDLYTSRDWRFSYRIAEVRVHQQSLADASGATTEQLWLQTSEGANGTPGKTQVIAQPISNGPASHADSVPTPHPVVCG